MSLQPFSQNHTEWNPGCVAPRRDMARGDAVQLVGIVSLKSGGEHTFAAALPPSPVDDAADINDRFKYLRREPPIGQRVARCINESFSPARRASRLTCPVKISDTRNNSQHLESLYPDNQRCRAGSHLVMKAISHRG